MLRQVAGELVEVRAVRVHHPDMPGGTGRLLLANAI